MKLRRAPLIAAVLASVAACQILANIGDDHFTVAIRDAEPDAPAPPPFVDHCAHARPPPKPPGPSNTASMSPYVFALETFDLGNKTDAGVTIGYDLDKVCTCFDGGSTAYDASRSCATPGDVTFCDDDGGIDNGFASLRLQLPSVGGLDVIGQLETSLRTEASCGRQALVFILRDYNGMADDEDVSFGVFVSDGIHETLDGGPGVVGPTCGEDAAGPAPAFAPKRDGTDVWSYPADTLRSDSTADDPIPIVLLTGYVSNFRLVISYDDDQHKLPFGIGRATLGLGTPVLTAKLVPLDDGKRFAMAEGVMGGRLNAEQVVAAVGTLPAGLAPDGGENLACTNPFFPAFRDIMCGNVDIQSLPGNDFMPRGCDAFSLMFQFSAGPARVHGLRARTEPDASSCEPGFDTCKP